MSDRCKIYVGRYENARLQSQTTHQYKCNTKSPKYMPCKLQRYVSDLVSDPSQQSVSISFPLPQDVKMNDRLEKADSMSGYFLHWSGIYVRFKAGKYKICSCWWGPVEVKQFIVSGLSVLHISQVPSCQVRFRSHLRTCPGSECALGVSSIGKPMAP